MSSVVQRTIARLRLNIFIGVFVKVTPETIKMLPIVEPYVTWAFPNLKSIRELILKRGQAKVKNKVIPVTDNTVTEEHLGKFDVILGRPHSRNCLPGEEFPGNLKVPVPFPTLSGPSRYEEQSGLPQGSGLAGLSR